MIQIQDKSKCCGCASCIDACPKQCIEFNEDNEGFRYPKVNVDKCIDCHICEKVCPVINKSEGQKIDKLYSASNKVDDIRIKSSSGGVFGYLAEIIIKQGGIVYGASFDDNWEVQHIGIEKIEDLHKLRSSKYLQSRCNHIFSEIKEQLKSQRIVLFSGTPCQVAGLKKFLRKDYDNLYCIDIICHGVPSPKVWRLYLAQLIKNNIIGPELKNIKEVDFRSKIPNWSSYQIRINSESGEYNCPKDEDPYFKAFIQNVTIRPICLNCPFKGGTSGSDITLADFWGIKRVDPMEYSDEGVSMIIDYGKNKFDLSGLNIKFQNPDCIESCNGSYYHSAQYNANRKILFAKIDSAKNIINLLNRCANPKFIQRIGNVLIRKFYS